MDCICNKQIPKSSETRVILGPRRKTWINGFCPAYSTDYPSELQGYINSEQFENMMENINEAIVEYMPCCFCFAYGYICCLCTLGRYIIIIDI